jgi:signal transduction histidine kinase
VPWLDRIVAEQPRLKHGSLSGYAVAIALVALALGLRFLLGGWLPGNPYHTFWPAAVLAAFFGGLGPGLLATFLGGIAAWYVLVPPFWSFRGSSTPDAIALASYFVISAVNCVIIHAFREAVARLRTERLKQEELARSLEARVAERTRELAEANARLRAEIAERKQAEAAALQSQKMEAIGQLTGGVAHDFNNLLTVIFGNLDALRLRMIGRDPALEKLIEAALRGAERAATLTQRLLAFSRRQALEPASIDVNKLVLGMSELMRRSLGEQIELETVLAGGLWRALADPHQLEVALLNLVINARDAMPTGGKLTIETANASLDEAYAAAHEQVTPGQYVLIAITDTGAGMSSEVAAKAFEPFFTTKQVGQGTGLGLSMVYGFIKQSGGHVKIYSEPGHGTTVKLYLPRVRNGARQQPAQPGNDPAVEPSGSGTILVVEDDEDVRAYAARVLREQGYRVIEAADGPAALKLLEGGERVDLLFTDVVLPQMNGRELAEAARQRFRRLKVVFTTGYSRNAIVHGDRLDRDVALIPKPFTAATLTERIRKELVG